MVFNEDARSKRRQKTKSLQLTAAGLASVIGLVPASKERRPISTMVAPSPVLSEGNDFYSSSGDWRDSPDAEMDGETLVNYLCDLDCGLQVLLSHVKLDMLACKDAMTFLKKRAAIEEEYGRSMLKLSQSMYDLAEKNGYRKNGTYGEAWSEILKVHEKIAEQRIKFSKDIGEVADEVQALFKQTDRSRKQLKDTGQKHERLLQDAEQSLDKAKLKYELCSEDWERSILQKNGEPVQPRRSKSVSLFKQPKTPGQLVKLEEEARMKAALANENYKAQLTRTNQARHEFYSTHLPRILTMLKETEDECSVALRYQLARYAFIYEQSLTSEAIIIDDDDGHGLRSITERINYQADLQEYVKRFAGSTRNKGAPERLYSEYASQSQPQLHLQQPVSNPKPIFGIDLSVQLERDQRDVPLILAKCAQAIEQYGLTSQGIYRVSGTNTQVQKLRQAFDRDAEAVDLNTEEYLSDINIVAGVLKQWFRELPDPLLTRGMYADFIHASKLEDERSRVIATHEAVNRLPDANYATLKFLMCHLDKIQQNQRHNKMGISNLAVIWGPNLLGATGEEALADMGNQCRVVEIILENYAVIFEADDE
ncbi:uncharacterized protein VTP21DRAFT_9599 [Calcarisporiella thermophila]|uniref:uncharacterized protein n=1 Tax=Calcarisporiella thermophila TaxID=911321 RepID=UPI003743BC75